MKNKHRCFVIILIYKTLLEFLTIIITYKIINILSKHPNLMNHEKRNSRGYFSLNSRTCFITIKNKNDGFETF